MYLKNQLRHQPHQKLLLFGCFFCMCSERSLTIPTEHSVRCVTIAPLDCELLEGRCLYEALSLLCYTGVSLDTLDIGDT